MATFEAYRKWQNWGISALNFQLNSPDFGTQNYVVSDCIPKIHKNQSSGASQEYSEIHGQISHTFHILFTMYLAYLPIKNHSNSFVLYGSERSIFMTVSFLEGKWYKMRTNFYPYSKFQAGQFLSIYLPT